MSERIYMGCQHANPMLWISFFRPKECFRGTFNNFAAWWTNGSFCHCELVIEASSDFLLTHVQQTYVKHMKNRDHRSKEIVQELERSVMNKYARRLIHKHGGGCLSFSLLFGDKLRIRVLDPESSEAWHQTPHQPNDVVVWKSVRMPDDALAHVYKWALEETGKPYDNTGALFSWMPSLFHDSVNPPKHFCSEFCVRALQRTGQLNGLKASHTTPNHLYHALQNFTPLFDVQETVGLDLKEMVENESKQDLADLEAMMEDSSDDEDTPETLATTKCPPPPVSPQVPIENAESKVYNTTCQQTVAPAPQENTEPAPANT